MTSPLTVTELLAIAGVIGGIITALAGAIAWLVKIHMDKRKDDSEAEHLDAETIATLRTTVNELVKSVDDLRKRVYALEAERDRNKRVIDGLRDYIRRLLQWVQEHGVTGYPEPEPGLLDTDPNMRAVK